MSDLTDVFPTRRYLRKPPKDQPFRGGLATRRSRFGSAAWSVPAGAGERRAMTQPKIACSTAFRRRRSESTADVRRAVRDAI